MDPAPEIALTLQSWLRHFDAAVGACAVSPAPTFSAAPRTPTPAAAPLLQATQPPLPPQSISPGQQFCSGFGSVRAIAAPANPATIIPALAALAAEALARQRSLWIVTADDALLPDLSNALDLNLRPLCLVLPGADYAGRIALRATFSLLKSRLARAAGDSNGPAWATQRAALAEHDTLWRACLAWSARGLDREAPPDGFAQLFPVRIGPALVATRLATAADWVVLAEAQRLPAALRTPWPQANLTLLLDGAPITGPTALVLLDENARLKAEIEVLGQELAEMELELATAQGELAAFSERYHALIAGRLADLDALRLELTQRRMAAASPAAQAEMAAEAAQAEARARQSRQDSDAYESRRNAEPVFKPDIDLKKRFRQLAQKIHPDRAHNETDRAWRTQLMSEANRAYRTGDVTALDEVMSLWQEGQEFARSNGTAPAGAVSPAPTFSPNLSGALASEAARIRQRLTSIAAELDRLYGSKLYELFAAARMAARQERDLLTEMADKLDRQIEASRQVLSTFDDSPVPLAAAA